MIIGNYAGMNLGDEAILMSMVSDLEQFTQRSKIYVPTRNRGLIRYIHRVKPVSFNPLLLLLALKRVNSIVIGGGSIFSNFAGRYVYFLPFFLILAKLMRRKIIFYSIGFDSNTPRFLKSGAEFSLLLSNYISVRDTQSLKNLRLLSKLRKINIVPDPVLSIYDVTGKKKAAEAKQKAETFLKKYKTGGRKLMGIATLPVKDKNFNKMFVNKFPKLISAQLDEHKNIDILAFNFYQGVDTGFNEKWTTKLDAGLKKRAHNITEWIDPLTMMEVLKQLDQFIAVRLHAKIFAHVAHSKYTAISYAQKCEAFCKSVNKTFYQYSKLLHSKFLAAIFSHA